MKQKYQTEELVISQSMCPPAVRMNYVIVFIDDNGKAEIYSRPVVALQTSVVHEFTRPLSSYGEYAPEPTSQAMQDANFDFVGENVRIRALILEDGDYFIATEEDESSNSSGKLVTLPWPYDPEKDQAEEKKLFAELEHDAREKIARRNKANAVEVPKNS